MTGAAVGAIAPVIEVSGQELAARTLNSLIGLHVSLGLRIPARAELEFLDDGFGISAGDTFQLGSTITVSTPDGSALFKGDVTGVELDVERGAPNLTVTADDRAYQMTLGNRVRTFTEVTYSEVVERIAREYGAKAEVTATSAMQEYLLQSDSDFGFITEIADRIGYDWWIDTSGTLQFHPMGSQRGSTQTLTWDVGSSSLRHFSVRASALHPQRATANGWDSDNQQPVTGTGEPTSSHHPDAALVKPYLKPTKLAKHSEVSSAFRMFSRQGDGKDFAKSTVERALAGSVTATGVCRVNPKIVVGNQVSVVDVGPASGSYPVTEVEHIYSASGFDTRFTAGDREPTTLVDTLSAPSTSSFRQDALVVGVVTNLGDSSSPKGHVKVKFPALGDHIESAWARVISAGAGESRGMTFLPEVQDEVIIGFEAGDVSRPLVLGGVYSGKRSALDYGATDGSVSKRQIVSRLGHVIELGDGRQPEEKHIWLMLKDSTYAIKLGEDGLKATVPSGKPATIAAGDTTIKLDEQGNIALSGQKITIEAKQDVEISGNNVKLKANAAVEASGLQAKMSGSTKAEVSSGGQTAISGTMVKIN